MLKLGQKSFVIRAINNLKLDFVCLNWVLFHTTSIIIKNKLKVIISRIFIKEINQTIHSSCLNYDFDLIFSGLWRNQFIKQYAAISFFISNNIMLIKLMNNFSNSTLLSIFKNVIKSKNLWNISIKPRNNQQNDIYRRRSLIGILILIKSL